MNKYCDKCQDICEVNEKDITKTFNVKGVDITATIHTLVCTKCNEEVYDEDIEKQNEKIVFDEYEKMKLAYCISKIEELKNE